MNETLIIVWVVIAIIGVISIVMVKRYYKEKEEETNHIEMVSNPLSDIMSENDDIKKQSNPISNIFSKDEEPNIDLRKEGTEPEKEFNPYIAPKNEENIPNRNISYSSQNQVLINYDDTVQKFQEPITDNQRDIMSQNTKEPSSVTFKKTTENKHELKDLFTIDELIKESKRKDDEREKESKTIKKETEDNSDIKESIKKNKEAKEKTENKEEEEKTENKDIADIKSSIEKMHEIAESIKSSGSDDLSPKSTASQKDINEAINTATTENETEKEEVPEISETKSITDAVIKKESEKTEETTVQKVLPIKEENETAKPAKDEKNSKETPENEEMKTPSLKTPHKIEEDSVSILSGADEDYEFGASIDSSNLFEDENGELSDLDYRKDLAKFTNSIKNSSIVKDIREKLIQEPGKENDLNEEFIRNVNSYTEESNEYYDEYEPIINETHVDYIEPEPDEQLRQENTRRVFNNAKSNTSEETTSNAATEESIPPIKEIPEKSSLKITINNNEEVLRKGDEIIFNHEGESYSSKVYSINGDNIKVRYRRKSITIKPKDIKKIY